MENLLILFSVIIVLGIAGVAIIVIVYFLIKPKKAPIPVEQHKHGSKNSKNMSTPPHSTKVPSTKSKPSNKSGINGFITLHEQGVRANPTDVDERADLAMWYGWGGRETDALREFNICFQSEPNNEAALVNYGLFQSSRGNVQEAIKVLEKAIKHASEPIRKLTAIGLLGAVYHMSGNLLQAIECWQSIDNPALYELTGFSTNLSLGIAYLQKGRVDEAWSKFEIAASLNKGEEDGGVARRFPSWALDYGKSRLSQWPKRADTQEILDLLVSITWGIGGPIAHGEMQRRVLFLMIEAKA